MAFYPFLQAGSITAKELKECFEALDLDGDGLLSRKELALAVRALGTETGLEIVLDNGLSFDKAPSCLSTLLFCTPFTLYWCSLDSSRRLGPLWVERGGRGSAASNPFEIAALLASQRRACHASSSLAAVFGTLGAAAVVLLVRSRCITDQRVCL